MNASTPRSWLLLLEPIFLMVCAALIIIVRVGQPDFPYFDELFYVDSAHDILSGLALGEVTHPPLAKLLIAGSIALFGDTPVAWRLPSVISGIALVGLVFGVLRGFGASRTAAVVGGLLVSLDGLCITQARIAMINAPSVALGFAALLCAQHRRIWGAGIFLGCSLGCKFTGLPFLVVIVALCGLAPVSEQSRGSHIRGKEIGALIFVTLLVYFVSFVPLYGFMSSLWSGILLYHSSMFEHHLFDANIVHRYGAPWWSWPILLRPIWYGFEEVGGGGLVRGVLCIANPFIAGLVLIGVIASVVRWARRRGSTYGERIALLGFLAHLLPWAFSPRLTMFHYYYPAYLFGIVLACLQLDRFSPRIRQYLVTAICVGSIGMFVYWYPLWTVMPITRSAYESMIWFSSWR